MESKTINCKNCGAPVTSGYRLWIYGYNNYFMIEKKSEKIKW